jgi:hypothetical protein
MRFTAEHTKNAEERREKNSKGNGENSFGVPASAGPGRVNAELQTFLPQENLARQPPQKNRAVFLFTVANKLWFAQWRRGDFHDFVWEHRSSNFFENFPCHHNR